MRLAALLLGAVTIAATSPLFAADLSVQVKGLDDPRDIEKLRIRVLDSSHTPLKVVDPGSFSRFSLDPGQYAFTICDTNRYIGQKTPSKAIANDNTPIEFSLRKYHDSDVIIGGLLRRKAGNDFRTDSPTWVDVVDENTGCIVQHLKTLDNGSLPSDIRISSSDKSYRFYVGDLRGSESFQKSSGRYYANLTIEEIPGKSPFLRTKVCRLDEKRKILTCDSCEDCFAGVGSGPWGATPLACEKWHEGSNIACPARP